MKKLIKVPMIQSMIIELRGRRVILDSDLAMLYHVPTKALNQAVRRNKGRFPSDFMFKLTKEEYDFLKSQIVTSGRIPVQKKKIPYVFTRNGANMICAVLKSPVAVQRSIQIMRAFSALEEALGKRKRLPTKSPDVISKLSTHSKAIMRLFQESKLNRKGIKKVKKIQREMINLLQRMVAVSMGKD